MVLSQHNCHSYVVLLIPKVVMYCCINYNKLSTSCFIACMTLSYVTVSYYIQNSVMADFTVTVDTSSITITWDASTVSGLTDFNITLDDEVKYTGSNTAGSYQITGLTAGTSYHLVITTNDGSTATPVDKTQYTSKWKIRMHILKSQCSLCGYPATTALHGPQHTVGCM